MKYRALGSTGLQVSELSFGAGPVAALFTDQNAPPLQREAVQRALEAGINWFDTAPTYGAGQSETNLGAALAALNPPKTVYVATKVRLRPEQLGNIEEAVQSSVTESLKRLQRSSVTLLQLHNSITQNRGDQPTSITPRDVLGKGGVLEAFEHLKAKGLVEHFGLTGLGDTTALFEIVRSGPWAAIQVCQNILHPSELRSFLQPKQNSDDEDPIVSVCSGRRIGLIAIRVLAGGALANQPPSAHTKTTPFFPLAVYLRDQAKAAQLARLLPVGLSLKELAVRFALNDPDIATALVGFAHPAQIDEAVRFAHAGPLEPELIRNLQTALNDSQLDS
jgi:aryl-alcohol dehydrogenase-like predicted oxidoreductase